MLIKNKFITKKLKQKRDKHTNLFYHYNRPSFEIISNVHSTYEINTIKNEISVLGVEPDFLRKNCGPIANSVLDVFPSWFYNYGKSQGLNMVCDVIVERITPNNYEYHFTTLDDKSNSKHIFAIVSSYSYTVPDIYPLKALENDELCLPIQYISRLKDGDVMCLDNYNVNKIASPFLINEWRLIFRMSMYFKKHLDDKYIIKNKYNNILKENIC